MAARYSPLGWVRGGSVDREAAKSGSGVDRVLISAVDHHIVSDHT